MLALDTSAVVALLLTGEDREVLRTKIESADVVVAGAPTLLECGMVLSSRLGYDARPLLRDFIRQFDIRIIPFDEDHYDAAVSAWLKFGKGRHPASLNFGDCLAYAVARLAGAPLLDACCDSGQTDVDPA